MSRSEGVVSKVIVAVVAALLVGGTAPWWWKEIRGDNRVVKQPPLPLPKAQACPPTMTFPAKEIVTRGKDAHPAAGDKDVDSDDWTRVDLSYEITQGDRQIDLILAWHTIELTRNREPQNTIIESNKTFRLVDPGDLPPTCVISNIHVEKQAHKQKDYSGKLRNTLPFPDTGALRNIRVVIDGPGDDISRQMLDARFAAFTVGLAAR